MSYTIIDRRLNPTGKNLGNRQRFLKRAKAKLRKSVRDGLQDRSITSDDDQNVSIPDEGVKEPSFRNNPLTGNREFVLPGNTDFVPGDLIEKPPKGGGGGGNASDDGDGEDEFQFVISKEEYHDILFEDLELPDLIKENHKETVSYTKVRTGYVNDGTPCNLDLKKSMRNSLGRRLALKKPKLKRIRHLKEEIAKLKDRALLNDTELDTLAAMEEELKVLRKKARSISFLDPIDLRYRNYENKPVPKHKAVMFCIMDVSASMGRHEKDLAKRFYLLLYMFLQYKYDTVDVVFIRHHSAAMECTEEEFFYSRETGGTIVSTGFATMNDIVKDRYSVDEWNIYVAQTSDGDNFESDNVALRSVLIDEVLPMVQYFAYIEVTDDERSRFMRGNSDYGLWPVYRELQETAENMAMKKVNDPNHVYAIFRELFSKEDAER